MSYRVEQLEAIIRTESTCTRCPMPDGIVPVVPVEPGALPDVAPAPAAIVPVISTSWFTCDDRSESFPSSVYVGALAIDEPVEPVADEPAAPLVVEPGDDALAVLFRTYDDASLPRVPVVPVVAELPDEPGIALPRSKHPVIVIVCDVPLVLCAEVDVACAMRPATDNAVTTAAAPVHVFQYM